MGTQKKTAELLPHEKREINGRTYVVHRLGWWELLEQLSETEKIIGPALIEFVKGDFAAADLRALLATPAEQLVGALLHILRKLTAKDGRSLMLAMAKQTMVLDEERGGKRRLSVGGDVDFMDRWFGHYPGDALLWLAFCLEVQFRDFFVIPGSALMQWTETQEHHDESQTSSETEEEREEDGDESTFQTD